MIRSALLAAALFAGPAAAEPNVVIILVDDLGWTDLGCQGSDLYRTPHIDRLAAAGMRFTDAYAACTVCSPTRAAMMTGKYPARLNITDWIKGHRRPKAKLKVPDWTMNLPKSEVTLAEALKADGYATGHVGKWHLCTREAGEAGWPDRHGFDVNVAGYFKGSPPSYFSPHRIPSLKDGPRGQYLTDRESAEAVAFIEKNKGRPFFLYLPHYCVHTPLQAKKDVVAKYKKLIKPGTRHRNPTYAAMVESVDDSVGRIVAKLDELKLTDNTLIIFTSDNGGLKLRRVTTNVPLRAGKGSSYEGGVRVPLIVKMPGRVPAGVTCAEPVITCDYYPTVLGLTGSAGDVEHNKNVDGLSLVPLFRNPKAKLDRDAIFWHYPHYHPGGATPYGAVRTRDWKLIEFFEDGRRELYHLSEDIGESRDVIDAHPRRAAAMYNALKAWRGSVAAQMPTPNPRHKPRRGG